MRVRKFDRNLIAGMLGSIYERKYITPVLKNLGSGMHVIRPDNVKRIHIVETMFRLTDIYEKKEEGYEFTIRSLLSELWYSLYKDVSSVIPMKEAGNHADSTRILTMMKYIQDHFGEKITIEEIAEAVNISVRECNRCFQNKIGMAPGKYLNDYRIRSAAELLLTTEDSITEVAEKCGFSSGSYFAKSFFKMIGCTPKEYRKSSKGER